jgi:uncharacterized membrane protein
MRQACGWAAKALLLLGAVAAVGLAGHHGHPWALAAGGIAHAACYVFLLWYFARSLAPAREPLVTRVARSVHGELPAAMEAFTRKLTIAWCVFFAGQLALSGLLLALVPLPAWPLLVNGLNLPLLALMFLGQFAYRSIRHPEFPRASPWQALQAFSRGAPVSNRAEMR